jgi:KDO2-lipid IV(A) lauroyltransferase
MLVDQYNVQGVTVTFFGRRTKTNAMLARLARQIECPIYGVRVVRRASSIDASVGTPEFWP